MSSTRKEVITAEGSKYPFAGTSLYMNTRLLREAVDRSVYDDLESLVYVVLYAFPDHLRTSNSGEPPIGFTFLSNKTVACMRIACTLLGKCLLDCLA
ncbi:hypothetical protein GGH13_003893 [Coemansia sp. S155-1]|nr:hypothetical protein GGH13_003893 [Coemansia sp. S155-1]